jgi:tetratricopeptide (TPR) repeat protein/DNA-binding XRE family transcriptional regulator
MAEDSQEFGERLAGCRRLTGLSQEELAQRSRLSVRTIGNLERGRARRPHPDTVRRLADALELRGQARDEFMAGVGRRFARGAPGAGAVLPPSGGQSFPGAGSSTPVPRQLPPAVRHFTGRKAELDFLDFLACLPDTSAVAGGGGARGALVISVIGGAAGVGKTALAVYWAHRAAGRFGDGQLYVDLRGFDPSGSPVTPAEAIRGFLDALGVPAERIPPNVDAQAGLYRSLLADKQMLIVLDNARDEGQVRPLLPASPASLVIVTSRNQLAGLAAADCARLMSLDVLAHDEAMQLLTARLGASRAAAEPAAASEIAALCAYLPLALAVTAARAAARPGVPLAALADELRGAADRLDILDAGDPAVSVQAVFSWSYRQLSTDAARMFRLLGLHPGPDIGARAAASLAAVGEPQGRRLLRELACGCLITEHAPGRYAFHDLLRAYAAEQGRHCDSQPDRAAAIDRVLDHYLHTAARAAIVLHPSTEALALAPPTAQAAPERPADHRQALAWFDAEHQVLIAAVTLAAETGADRHAWQLPCAMSDYLKTRGYPHDRVTVMASALAAATRLDDVPGQALSFLGLGKACARTGDYDQARAHLERCLQLYQRLGDRMGEALAQENLAALAEVQGRYAEAVGHNEQALCLFRAIGDEAREARVLGTVGWCHALLGEYQRARALCEQSLALVARLGGGHREYHILDTLGYIEFHLGHFVRATAHFEYALSMCRDRGDRFVEGEILTHLGDACHAVGELPRARQAWQRALAIADDIQHLGAGELRAKLARTR